LSTWVLQFSSAGAAVAGAGATTTRARLHATEHTSTVCPQRGRMDRADAGQVLAPARPDPVGVSMNRLIYNRLLARPCARARKNVSYARSSRRLNSGFAGPTRRTSPPRSRPSRHAHKAASPGTQATRISSWESSPRRSLQHGVGLTTRRCDAGRPAVGRIDAKRHNRLGSHHVATQRGPRCMCGRELISIRRVDGGVTHQRTMAGLGPARHRTRVVMKGTGPHGDLAVRHGLNCAGRPHQHTPG